MRWKLATSSISSTGSLTCGDLVIITPRLNTQPSAEPSEEQLTTLWQVAEEQKKTVGVAVQECRCGGTFCLSVLRTEKERKHDNLDLYLFPIHKQTNKQTKAIDYQQQACWIFITMRVVVGKFGHHFKEVKYTVVGGLMVQISQNTSPVMNRTRVSLHLLKCENTSVW